jgi:hypothetical protein
MREATLFALASLSEQLVELEVCAFYIILKRVVFVLWLGSDEHNL